MRRRKPSTHSNQQRQAAFKRRMRDVGLVQVSGWLHPHQRADLNLLFRRLQSNPNLTVGPVRNEATGRLEKLDT